MDKKEFYELVKEMVEAKYSCSCRIITMQKEGFSYAGMIQETEDENISFKPVVNLDAYYDDYCKGADMSDIADGAYKTMTSYYPYPGMEKQNLNKLMEYENAKQKLFISVVNVKRNAQYLEDKVYETFGDIAIIPKIFAFKTADYLGSAAITKKMLKEYPVSAEELIAEAKSNMLQLFTPICRNMKDFIIEIMMENGMTEEQVKNILPPDEDMEDHPIYILTTQQDRMASILFCDGILEQIRNQIGDFYIIPSSVEEVILIPENFNDTDEIYEMLHSVNGNSDCIEERKILSDHIYRFNGTLSMAK